MFLSGYTGERNGTPERNTLRLQTTIALSSLKLMKPGDLLVHPHHLNLSRTCQNRRHIVANGEERHGKHFLLAGGPKTRRDGGWSHHWSLNPAQIVRRWSHNQGEVQKVPACLSGKRLTGSTFAHMFQGGKLSIYGRRMAKTNGGLTRSATSGICVRSSMSKIPQTTSAGSATLRTHPVRIYKLSNQTSN